MILFTMCLQIIAFALLVSGFQPDINISTFTSGDAPCYIVSAFQAVFTCKGYGVTNWVNEN